MVLVLILQVGVQNCFVCDVCSLIGCESEFTKCKLMFSLWLCCLYYVTNDWLCVRKFHAVLPFHCSRYYCCYSPLFNLKFNNICIYTEAILFPYVFCLH